MLEGIARYDHIETGVPVQLGDVDGLKGGDVGRAVLFAQPAGTVDQSPLDVDPEHGMRARPRDVSAQLAIAAAEIEYTCATKVRPAAKPSPESLDALFSFRGIAVS